VEANPTGEITNSSIRDGVLTPANTRKIASIYILPAVFLQSVSHMGDLNVTEQTSELSTNAVVDALKGWVMVILTLGFVSLYGLALIGKLKPLADASMVSRLEPIIFVIIGYYFGRLPAQQNEKTLKDEIGRQTQKADAAQHAKEQALQSREAVEERLKNVGSALLPTVSKLNNGSEESKGTRSEEGLRHVVGVAARILKS
jgi:hypothetical protein